MEITGLAQLGITLVGLLITGLSISSRIGTFNGIVETKIDYLEKKMDKHNNLIERTAIIEQNCKSIHRRIDEIKEDFHN